MPALVLAAIGVYGVLSYVVSQGTRDIGVRVMLGAQRESILVKVFKHGLYLAGGALWPDWPVRWLWAA